MRPFLNDQRIEEVHLCPRSSTYRAAFGSRGSLRDYLANYPDEYTLTAHYWLSYSVLSDPAMWRSEGDLRDERLLRAVRIHEVRFPSSKGVLLEATATHLRPRGEGAPSILDASSGPVPFVVSFADGRVASVKRSTMLEPVTDNGILPRYAAPVQATRDGVRGRDVP